MDLRKFFPGLGADAPPTLPPNVAAAVTTSSLQPPPPPPSTANAVSAPAPTSAAPTPASAAPAPASSSTPSATAGGSLATRVGATSASLDAKDAVFTLSGLLPEDSELADPTGACQVSPVTVYRSDPLPRTVGSRVGESAEYVGYAIRKGGGIRIIHRATVKNLLLVGHDDTACDLAFSPLMPNMLASVAPDGKCIVWELRVASNPDTHQPEMMYRVALDLRVNATQDSSTTRSAFHRVVWHPSVPAVLAVVSGSSVAVVQLSATLWDLQQKAGGAGVPLSATGAIMLQHPNNSEFNDVCFAPHPSAPWPSFGIITSSQSGEVSTWHLDAGRSAQQVSSFSPYGSGNAAQGLALSGDGMTLATANDTATQLTLWARDNNSNTWERTQGLSVRAPSGQDCHMRWTVSDDFLKLAVAPRDANALVVFSMGSSGKSRVAQSAVQLNVGLPVLSLYCSKLVGGQPRAAGSDTLELYCVQPRMIQCIKVLFSRLPTQQQPPKKLQHTGSSSTLLSPLELLTTPPVEKKEGVAVNGDNNKSRDGQGRGAESESQSSSHSNGGDSMARHMSELRAFLKAESEKRALEERERQKLLLQALAKTVQTIPATVQTVIHQQLMSDAVVDKIASAVVMRLEPTMKQIEGLESTVEQSVGESMRSLTSATAREMSVGFRSAFAETVLPAFEAGCQEMVTQWRDAAGQVSQAVVGHAQQQQRTHPHPHQPAAALRPHSSTPPSRPLPSPASAAATMSSTAAASVPTVPTAAGGGGVGQWQTAAPVSVPQLSADLHKHLTEVENKLKVGDIEGAFYIALCSSNLDVLVSTCNRVDREQLFRREPLPISQGILLTLLQQLSVDLSTDTQVKVLWLSGVFSRLNPNDPSISQHAPRYVATLKENLATLAPQYSAGEFQQSANEFAQLQTALR